MTKEQTGWLRIRWLVLAVMVALVLMACESEGEPEATEPPADTEEAVETTLPDEEVAEQPDEELTLTVWTRTPCETWEALFELYEEENPHITIENTCHGSYEDVVTAWPAALQAGNPPDVGMVDAGFPGLPAHVQVGWIRDLTDDFEERNWADRYVSPTTPDYWNSFSFYEGRIYTVPTVASVRGMYYNMDLLAELGAEVPESLDELETLCDTAIAAGFICLGLGNLGAWGTEGYWLNLFYNELALGDYEGFLRGIFEGDPGVPWGGDEVGQALETFVEWESRGYFNPEYNAIAENDIPAEFLRGDMVGLWYWSEVNPRLVEAEPEFEIQFFNFPRTHEGAPILGLTNPSSNWAIPADAAHPEEAVAYLDWLLTSERAVWLLGQGLMPLLRVEAGAELPAPWIPGQLDAAADQVFMGWLNFSTPGLGDFTGPEVQRLLVGDTTIDDVLAAFQAVYEEGAAEIRELAEEAVSDGS